MYHICGVKLAKKQYLLRLVSLGGFFRVEEFTDLLVFVNYVYNWKIWRYVNDGFKQFCCGCVMFLLSIRKVGMYTKLWTEDGNERASKCR